MSMGVSVAPGEVHNTEECGSPLGGRPHMPDVEAQCPRVTRV